MPYIVKDSGEEGSDTRYCVYKKGPDGQPEGKSFGCHPSEEKANNQIAAIYANETKAAFEQWEPGQIIAVKAGDEWTLEVLGLPYGGPIGGKDLQKEYFDEQTDFMLKPGDTRPVIYFHGDNPGGQPDMRPEVIGTAVLDRYDAKGGWFQVTLDKAKKYAQRLWQAAVRGAAAASSGAVAHLVRKGPDGRIITWPVGELTLLDTGEGRMPANPFATVSVKALYDEAGIQMPEAFAEAERDSVVADAAEDDGQVAAKSIELALAAATAALEAAQRASHKDT
jgi:hypothetical protein